MVLGLLYLTSHSVFIQPLFHRQERQLSKPQLETKAFWFLPKKGIMQSGQNFSLAEEDVHFLGYLGSSHDKVNVKRLRPSDCGLERRPLSSATVSKSH